MAYIPGLAAVGFVAVDHDSPHLSLWFSDVLPLSSCLLPGWLSETGLAVAEAADSLPLSL